MNLWKPTALVLAFALALMVGNATSSANPREDKPIPVSQVHDYRHMRLALEHLRMGRNELEWAEHNRGGWRERAVEASERAIYETKQALDW